MANPDTHPPETHPPDTHPPDAAPSSIDESFLADRQMFWSRFTGATTLVAIGVAALLVALLIFVY